LEDLHQDPDIGEYIDMFTVGLDLERQMEDKWFVVCHNPLFSKLINQKRKPLL